MRIGLNVNEGVGEGGWITFCHSHCCGFSLITALVSTCISVIPPNLLELFKDAVQAVM